MNEKEAFSLWIERMVGFACGALLFSFFMFQGETVLKPRFQGEIVSFFGTKKEDLRADFGGVFGTEKRGIKKRSFLKFFIC